ncbi:MAG: hypothetical protein AB8G16_17310 [Gammaproteobacteria bacterium]
MTITTDNDPSSTMPTQTAKKVAPATRTVFDTSDDARNALYDVARAGRRSICLFTPDLEPEQFSRLEFMDIIKNLILTHKFARVRVLVKSPMRCVREGHRLVELARRFSSFLEIREVHSDYRGRADTFLVADQNAVIYRANASRFEGIADTHSPTIALHYLEFFETAWNRSTASTELRQLHL